MDIEDLTAEARVFCRYLLRCEADAYVCRKYCEYQSGAAAPIFDGDAFDRRMVRFASRGVFCTSMADSYSALFRRQSLLRKKLVLLLAILECSPAHYARLQRPDTEAGIPLALLFLGWRVARFAVTATAGALVLSALRLRTQRMLDVADNACRTAK